MDKIFKLVPDKRLLIVNPYKEKDISNENKMV